MGSREALGADHPAPHQVGQAAVFAGGSDAARQPGEAAAAGAFNSLFLGLGVVALLVGAVGVANIMIISVLERRSEIGLRRALGATTGQIRTQFLGESILLAVIGGFVGVLAGAAATVVYAGSKSWAVVIPVEAWAGGIASAVHYPVPIHRTEAYTHLGLGAGSRPVSERLAERICSLPLWPGMTDAQLERVVDAVREFAPPSAGVGRFARSSQALGAPARTSSESTAMTA